MSDVPINRSSTLDGRQLWRRRRRTQSGSTLVVLTLTLLGIAVIGITTAQLSDVASRVSNAGGQKIQSTALAEAGIHTLAAQISTSMNANGTAPASLSSTSLSTTINGVTRAVGTYSAQVISTSTTPVPNSTKVTYKFTIDGYGTAASTNNGGATSQVRAVFTGVLTPTTSGGGSANPAFGKGAIQAAGKVQINTNQGFRTLDQAGKGGANVVANGGIGWSRPDGQSRANSNPNILDFDGQAMVPGLLVDLAAYPFTISTTTGLYVMKNGLLSTPVFVSKADTTSNILSNTVAALTASATFPDAVQVAAWQTQWLSESKSTSNLYSGTVTPSSLASNPSTGEKRLTAPAYINGDLAVNSGQLYLQPNSDTTKSNVIYVTGDVTNSALLYNRGVKLIVAGKYLDGNSSALYSLQTQYSPYTTMTQLMGVAALVSLKPASDAITLYTNSSGPAGLIYSAVGGMAIYGNNEVDGALVSGGIGAFGGISISPNGGNSFVVKYYAEVVIGRTDFPTILPTTTNSFLTQTRALTNWVQLK